MCLNSARRLLHNRPMWPGVGHLCPALLPSRGLFAGSVRRDPRSFADDPHHRVCSPASGRMST